MRIIMFRLFLPLILTCAVACQPARADRDRPAHRVPAPVRAVVDGGTGAADAGRRLAPGDLLQLQSAAKGVSLVRQQIQILTLQHAEAQRQLRLEEEALRKVLGEVRGRAGVAEGEEIDLATGAIFERATRQAK